MTGVSSGHWQLVVEQPGYAAHTSQVEVAGSDVEAPPVFLEATGKLETEPRGSSRSPALDGNHGPGAGC